MKFRQSAGQWIATLMICFGLWIGLMGVLNMPSCETGADQQSVAQAVYDEALLLVKAAADEAAELELKENKTEEEAEALATAQATIVTLQGALKDAADAEGKVGVDSGLAVLTNFIPPPWNVPSGILVGMFGTWMKGRKGRKSFQALVGAINTVKREVPSFATSIEAVGSRLRTAMGPQATAVVDVARKEGKFPIV